MEVQEMEEAKNPSSNLTSAAAFVEGGIQDACDDACSICLEEFSESDPSTVTNCKHEFHLQCVLEWCQRSSQCPMCWQAISLKDPTSQELLEGVEHERNIRTAPPRNATIFHHPTLGNFELQHLPVGANDAELEERIIQHLTAAAAMGRAHHYGRRDGHRNRSSAHNRPHFLVFSTHTTAPSSAPVSSSLAQAGGEAGPNAIAITSPSTPLSSGELETSQQVMQFAPPLADQNSSQISGSHPVATNRRGLSLNDRAPSQSSPPNQDRAGPSDLQSFSEALKSKFNAVSMRYKESIAKSTRGWKERFFSRNTSMPHFGSEDRAEADAGIASVSRMMENLETRDNNRTSQASIPNHSSDSLVINQDNTEETHEESPLNGRNAPPSCAASSISS